MSLKSCSVRNGSGGSGEPITRDVSHETRESLFVAWPSATSSADQQIDGADSKMAATSTWSMVFKARITPSYTKTRSIPSAPYQAGHGTCTATAHGVRLPPCYGTR